MEIELERTFLVKFFPEGLEKCEMKEIVDIYFPTKSNHPTLRIRKRGDIFEMTKKAPLSGSDSSEQYEKTIPLTEEEFNELATIVGKRFRKHRYYFPSGSAIIEIDVYQDSLEGLVVADVEFSNREEMEKFQMPDFCLVEVTQDRTIAGGMLAGKVYADIEKTLEIYEYKKLIKG